jgi:hypothetical protein
LALPCKEVDFPDSVDFFCLTRRKIRLSTAAHNSAHFPYVSPPGLILNPNDPQGTKAVDRILDGGYFETLGAITISDLIPRLDAIASKYNKHASIVVLALENDPGPADGPRPMMQDALRPLTGAINIAPDLIGPPFGLAMARSGHGSYARSNLERNQQMASSSRPTFVSFHVLSRSESGRNVDPTMSWFLSRRTTDAMLDNWCNDTCDVKTREDLRPLWPSEQRRRLAESLSLDPDTFNTGMMSVCAKLIPRDKLACGGRGSRRQRRAKH